MVDIIIPHIGFNYISRSHLDFPVSMTKKTHLAKICKYPGEKPFEVSFLTSIGQRIKLNNFKYIDQLNDAKCRVYDFLVCSSTLSIIFSPFFYNRKYWMKLTIVKTGFTWVWTNIFSSRTCKICHLYIAVKIAWPADCILCNYIEYHV